MSEKEERWIPITEMNPIAYSKYFVTIQDAETGKRTISRCTYSEKGWTSKGIIAWMHIDPYEGRTDIDDEIARRKILRGKEFLMKLGGNSIAEIAEITGQTESDVARRIGYYIDDRVCTLGGNEDHNDKRCNNCCHRDRRSGACKVFEVLTYSGLCDIWQEGESTR